MARVIIDSFGTAAELTQFLQDFEAATPTFTPATGYLFTTIRPEGGGTDKGRLWSLVEDGTP